MALRRFMLYTSRSSKGFIRCSTVHRTRVVSRSTSNVATTKFKCDDSEKVYSEKIQRIVTDISHLSLLEASQLNELLKSTLNLSDVPVAAMGVSIPVNGPPSSESGAKEEEPISFTVKLVKYADDSKIKLIKEVKSLVEGMNLVQAKKFVEGVPQVIQRDVSKETASKLKTALEAVGGVVELE